MAIIAMHSAATGLKALSTQLDVISNNLANANNDGFKASRVNFADLFYQQMQQPGSAGAENGTRPSGIMVGLGTRVASTQLDFTQGSAVKTGDSLDLYIQGEGFFKIRVLSNQGSGIAYTRAGHFVQDKDGNLVLNLGEGYKMEPSVQLPPGSANISVSTDGKVSYVPPGDTVSQEGPTIMLARFPNPAGLTQIGDNLFQTTAASGEETLTTPGSDSAGTLRSGFVESSNVDPVSELVSLIKTQRTFELNSQSIQAADQMLQQVSQLRR